MVDVDLRSSGVDAVVGVVGEVNRGGKGDIFSVDDEELVLVSGLAIVKAIELEAIYDNSVFVQLNDIKAVDGFRV